MLQAILLKATPLGYLGRKRHLGLKKKVRSVEKWNRRIKEVETRRLIKTLTSRLLEPHSKARFNE